MLCFYKDNYVFKYKAKVSCETAGYQVSDHFADVNKMVGLGSKREITDIALTRNACYLIAQNGDPRKEEIAFAQSNFQTFKRLNVETSIKIHNEVFFFNKYSTCLTFANI